MQCEKCGFPMTEIIGVFREEPKREDKKVCLHCLKKKTEGLEERIDNLEHGYRKPKMPCEKKK